MAATKSWNHFFRSELCCLLIEKDNEEYSAYIGVQPNSYLDGAVFKSINGIVLYGRCLPNFEFNNEALSKKYWLEIKIRSPRSYDKTVDDLKNAADRVGQYLNDPTNYE